MSRALFQAVRSGDVKRVQAALAKGADPNAQLKSGPTALTLALTHDRLDAARALIEAGADVNLADGDGQRPLDIALLYGTRKSVQMLIEHGARADYVRSDGDTALMAAGGCGDLTMVQMFLAAGADPDVPRAIDGLTVADIQVLVIQSPDATPGMRRSSQRILDALAAVGATVRSVAEIERRKDAYWRARSAVRK